jgi:hypothetical protein
MIIDLRSNIKIKVFQIDFKLINSSDSSIIYFMVSRMF